MRIALAGSQTADPVRQDVLVAEALRRVGHEAACVNWSDNYVRWDVFDAVAVRSCWDYHLHYREFLSWLERMERAGVKLINSPSLIRWNADKRYLAQMAHLGVVSPDTVWLGDGEKAEIAEICAARGWARAVSKPLVSASAWRTEVRVAGAVAGPWMVQEFVDEIETDGEWSLLYFGGVFSHAVKKTAAKGEFRVQSEFGGRVTAVEAPVELRRFSERVMRQAPERAAIARVDVVMTERCGPVLMELEVIEPELFLTPEKAERVAEVLVR